MLFTKGSSEEESDVTLVPQVPVEDKLDEETLNQEYGFGFKLLLQKGFSPGEGIGKRKGISEPLRVNARRQKETLSEEELRAGRSSHARSVHVGLQHFKKPRKLKSSEISYALQVLTGRIKTSGGRLRIAELRDLIERDLIFLRDVGALRLFLCSYPLVFSVTSDDWVTVLRPDNRISCECGLRLPTRGTWASHVLEDRFESHNGYKEALRALQGMEHQDGLNCLVCRCSFVNALDLVLHAKNSGTPDHTEFSQIVFAGLLAQDGMHAVDFLAALMLGDTNFDWKAFKEVAIDLDDGGSSNGQQEVNSSECDLEDVWITRGSIRKIVTRQQSSVICLDSLQDDVVELE